jgi:hypothetical protein
MPIPAEQLHSSIAEVLQHQSAIDRLAQMPLDSVGNNSHRSRKAAEGVHEKSQWRKKENSPIKNESKNATPMTTPNKEQLGIQTSENNQKGSKNKKKGSRQNT